jgi:DNA-binding GntR family transcriptional regulator
MPRAALAEEPRTATYLQIADTLAQRIARRQPGAHVESEHELAAAFHVNRLTARAALDELERRFIVRRARGRGTFVARRIVYRIGPDRTPSWTETVRQAGGSPRTENERIRPVAPPRWVCHELGLGEGDKAMLLQRRRWVDGELATWSTHYLRPDTVPAIERRMGAESSLYQVLTGVYELMPRRAWSRCELEVAGDAIARQLGLRGREHVFVLRGRLDCARLRLPIEVSIGYSRMDVFHVVYEYGAGPQEVPAS